jgi:hypothetical protein
MSAMSEWSDEYEAEVTDPRAAETRLLLIVGNADLPFDIRAEAINHANMSRRALINVVNEGEFASTVLILSNDVDLLDYFAGNSTEYLRAIIAFNPSTPPLAVEDLSRDRSPLVRLNAGMNPNLSTHSRTRLALHDPDPFVRKATWWTMTTPDGRAAIDGERTVMVDDLDETPDSGIRRFRVAMYHLDENVELLS